MSSTDNAVSIVVAAFIVTTLAAAGLWDIYAVGTIPARPTVSAVLRGWAERWPFGLVLLGALIGHLLWNGRAP